MVATGANTLPQVVVEEAFRDQYGRTLNFRAFKDSLGKVNRWYEERGIFGQVRRPDLSRTSCHGEHETQLGTCTCSCVVVRSVPPCRANKTTVPPCRVALLCKLKHFQPSPFLLCALFSTLIVADTPC